MIVLYIPPEVIKKLLNWLKNMNNIALIFFIVFMTVANNSIAGENLPIEFNYLMNKNPNDISALSGECTGSISNHEIECEFTQISARLKIKPEELQKEIEKAKKRVHDEVKGKDLKTYIKEACSGIDELSIGELNKKLKQKMNENNSKITNSQIAQMKDMVEMCKSPSLEIYEKFAVKSIIRDSKTCMINTFKQDWSSKFKKVAPNKWVSNTGPTGLCESVFLMILEHEPEYPSLWKFSHTRTYANTNVKICKKLDINTPLEFTWEGIETFDLKCEYIEFGL